MGRSNGGGEKHIMRSLLLTKYYVGDQIKKNELTGACGTYGGEDRFIQVFCGET